MTFDDLLSVLRAWTGRTVTMFATLTSEEGALDDPITGTLFEGHAPGVLARSIRPVEYEPTDDYAQFGLWRDPAVPTSRWPVGITYMLMRGQATARWDSGRGGKAIWIVLAKGLPSLWVLEDE